MNFGARKRLTSSKSIRRAAWTLGELVHRRETVESTQRETVSDGSEPEVLCRGEISPSYFGVPDASLPLEPDSTFSVHNPVLTASDVTDYGDVDFVADPFLFVTETGEWHLFFEVYNRDVRPTGVIGHATSEDGGRSWEYDRIVLQSDVHTAFPYVFEVRGDYYMVPDRWNRTDPASIRLYRTDELPDDWSPVSTIVSPDRQLADCVLFRWDGRWWAILGSDDGKHELLLYYSDDLINDEWTPHERNPVASGRPQAARPASRLIVTDSMILVFFQDCIARYGDKVRAYEVEHLSPDTYVDRERAESPVLESSNRRFGWNSGQMHHIDPWYTTDGWRCAVDGNIGLGRRAFGPDHWAIGMYRM